MFVFRAFPEMARIPFGSISIGGLPYQIISDSVRLLYRAGGKKIKLESGPEDGFMPIRASKLRRLQRALLSSRNQKLRTIILDANGSAANFTDGVEEFSLSASLGIVSRVSKAKVRSSRGFLSSLSEITAEVLENPRLLPNQLVPVQPNPLPSATPSPSPQPSPQSTPSDGSGGDSGASSRSFLLDIDSASSTISFGGTATGQISLNGPAGSTSTFSRAGLARTVSISPLNTYTIALGTASNDLDASTYTSAIKVSGATVADLIQGSLQADSITAGDGNDTIAGGEGADTITGGNDADSLDGGDGNDVFLYSNEAQLEDGSELVDDTIIGGAGVDRISVADGLTITNTVSFTKASSVEELYVTGAAASSIALDVTAQTAGINTINISTATADSTVDVGEFDTTGVYITGGSGNDNFVGGDGDDTISGGDGNDQINAGAGSNTVAAAGIGDDTITHSTAGSTVAIEASFAGLVTLNASQSGATATVSGSSDSRSINASTSSAAVTIDGSALGASQAGTYVGGSSADTITGGAGDDTIDGGAGPDSIDGGLGNDRLVYASNAKLALDSTVIGGGGIDTIYMDTGVTFVNLSDAIFVKVTQVETLDLAGTGTQNVTLGTNTNNSFSVGMTITTDVTATSLNLQGALSTVAIDVTGTNNADTIIGGAGNDTITGGAGNDNVTLGTGVDVVVFGGSGALGAVTGTAAQVATNLGFDTVGGYSGRLNSSLPPADSIQLSQAAFGSTATGAQADLAPWKFTLVSSATTKVNTNHSAGGFVYNEGNGQLLYVTADMSSSSTTKTIADLAIGTNAVVIGTFTGGAKVRFWDITVVA